MRVRQLIRDVVVHRDEEHAWRNTVREKRFGSNSPSLGFHDDPLVRLDLFASGIKWIYFDVGILRIKGTQHGGLLRASLCMPLACGSSAGEQQVGVFCVGPFWHDPWQLEEKAGLVVRVMEDAIGEESALW